MNSIKAALSIAGSDSGGGAGIQADLKTFEAHEVFGLTALTAVTAQNSIGVHKVMPVPVEMVTAQLDALLSDFSIGAAKTGMLFSETIIQHVADKLKGKNIPLVVDPVMVASSGDPLLQEEAIVALREVLLPLATVVTPNLHEAALLAEIEVQTRSQMERAAEIISGFSPDTWVLVKGGHLGDDTASDFLYHSSGYREWINTPFIPTSHTHGTGCTLSAAIAARLALGETIPFAVKGAKKYLTGAIRSAWSGIGKGYGSLRHHHIHYANLST
ncbi:MAG TPA: bifunctional hydroxymethylpyrimidine kinase/phosphomethylpyrimidine kinase [Bacteroidetes bacterium]|nr:bifunctional hydroxymethylpyrimidine kinase/phosphomethylpyrimidine kinase [Bacteroidota bacterium]